MYSFEIRNILENNNYNIDSETYLNICKNSPQIIRVKYNPWNTRYEIWTSDDFYFNFLVYRKQ